MAGSKDCFTLFSKCQSRYNCLAALINVKLECPELLFGEGRLGCTKRCKQALDLFGQNRLGKHFMDCACERDSECLTYQARAGKCVNNRMNDSLVGCATFSRKCENDSKCNDLMEDFYIKCNHLISGTECTRSCEIAQERLYSHNISIGLLNCECSGTVREENFCRGVRAHTFHLCKNSPLFRKKEEKNKILTRKPLNEGRDENVVELSVNNSAGSNSRHSHSRLQLLSLLIIVIFIVT